MPLKNNKASNNVITVKQYKLSEFSEGLAEYVERNASFKNS